MMVSKKIAGAVPAEWLPASASGDCGPVPGQPAGAAQITVCIRGHLWYRSNLFMIRMAPLFSHCKDIRVCTYRSFDTFA